MEGGGGGYSKGLFGGAPLMVHPFGWQTVGGLFKKGPGIGEVPIGGEPLGGLRWCPIWGVFGGLFVLSGLGGVPGELAEP